MIRIKSKQNNFRRCGMAHPAQAVDYPDDKFTKEQLAALKTEPMLIVEEIEDVADEVVSDGNEISAATGTCSGSPQGSIRVPGNKAKGRK